MQVQKNIVSDFKAGVLCGMVLCGFSDTHLLEANKKTTQLENLMLNLLKAYNTSDDAEIATMIAMGLAAVNRGSYDEVKSNTRIF